MWEWFLIAAIAWSFAELKLITSFSQYRGLLFGLLWNPYAWVFLISVAIGPFFIDVIAWPYVKNMMHGEVISHVSLILGHTGFTAASAYSVPVLLGKIIPSAPGVAAGVPKPTEKRAMEMNEIFNAIRESLAGRANQELCTWTSEHSWKHLRFAAHMLVSDQNASEAWTQLDAFQRCDDENDRQKKYDLLLTMVHLSSFTDVRMRLKQAAK